ncbi:hypothetical protein AOLI_G00187490 [Acnodon oligacanthus]
MEAILAEDAGCSQVCSVVGADCSDSECKEEEAEGRARPQLGDTAEQHNDALQKDHDTLTAAADSPEAKPMGTPYTPSD